MRKRYGLAAVTLALFAATSSSAAVIDGITVNIPTPSEVSPTAGEFSQPTSVTSNPLAQIEVGQPGQAGNPAELSNPGWDPYGTADMTHAWWNLYSGSVTFNLSGNALGIVWGSPNYNDPTNTNYVEFYSGANGGGTLLGEVKASDLYASFPSASPAIDNNDHAGYLVAFSGVNYGSVVFGNNAASANDFEFAVTGVPEASTWLMMLVGFGCLGFAGYQSSRKTNDAA